MAKKFFINVETAIGMSTEQPLVLLVNSVGTYESLKLSQFSCQGSGVVFKYYLNPTITAVGPAGTPRNREIGCPTLSQMNVYCGATYSSFGVYLGQQIPQDLILDPGYELLVTATGPMSTSLSGLAMWEESR